MLLTPSWFLPFPSWRALNSQPYHRFLFSGLSNWLFYLLGFWSILRLLFLFFHFLSDGLILSPAIAFSFFSGLSNLQFFYLVGFLVYLHNAPVLVFFSSIFYLTGSNFQPFHRFFFFFWTIQLTFLSSRSCSILRMLLLLLLSFFHFLSDGLCHFQPFHRLFLIFSGLSNWELFYLLGSLASILIMLLQNLCPSSWLFFFFSFSICSYFPPPSCVFACCIFSILYQFVAEICPESWFLFLVFSTYHFFCLLLSLLDFSIF